jgi:hypothetical protein
MMDENRLKPEGILPGEPPARPAALSEGKLNRQRALLGFLTLAGLGFVILGVFVDFNETNERDRQSIDLWYGSGAFLLLGAGLPWAHTRDYRILKSLFLGAVGFVFGGTAGTFLGIALDPGSPETFGLAILLMYGGCCLGAILFGCLGVWWGLRFHRRYGSG